ncbi:MULTISPECIES: Tol-Pal system beta propeller repeat protein TolB [unclassified Lysobacter]|uniref:Tol-Pal system beta propeller repeat protein TolB n=1 Tax=unclassified Lysobacter TaxID=2635362 RepID=UPI001BED0E0D|nr:MULTISPECIES: Tol-Pal system beta propeller repeat protein TolB [unclassified Lysobacter]MBT2745828.1 Tol-Pal system beta propeller repeat protein TolB [Lysobacter sp. ISL-42]MBT2749613.1 Tol-Pal system beta propeller repeat protein TolB [Lysobacter sp. ISL-50]MBT2778743.1 Tol-Pal system beta propeller repeat protein TolB [Lysobacter sp. ISL-54]MBT2781338.1 Tol-Pal system beta propeller repeat protein TolB [Lysobacter sp. ISL-52]
MKRSLRWLASLLALLLPLAAAAQQQGLEIDIVGGNASATPIAVVPMPYQGGGAAPPTDIAEVVRNDLNRSGQFRGLPVEQMTAKPTKGSEISYPDWRALNQDYIVVGRVADAGAGSYRVEYELFDVAKQQRLLGFALTARSNAMRDVAHQIADAVYEKITGVRGAFFTRIAYVTATGLGRGSNFALMVADSDGYNPQTVVRSPEPLVSPSWSPDGNKLAYVSFEGGNSSIYIQNIGTGSRELIAKFRGINGAPAFSPDGRRLALTLSRSGNPEIYVMDLGSKALTQLTNHFAIDTEPTWSADGGKIYFTSDRGGKPQIYVVAASGGGATRVTFQGSYNASADVSYDGKKIVTAQGAGSTYRIAMMDSSLGSPRWSTLSPGSLDESPSFAPNASMIIYAAREGRRGVLYAVSADARVRQRLVLADGDVREPAWGPYRLPR